MDLWILKQTSCHRNQYAEDILKASYVLDDRIIHVQQMAFDTMDDNVLLAKFSLSHPHVGSASTVNTFLRCCTFAAILLQCCGKVSWESTVTPSTFCMLSNGSTGRPASLEDVGSARDYLA